MCRSRIDSVVGGILAVVSGAACVVVALIFAFLIVDSLPAITALGVRMWTDGSWHPADSVSAGTFGMAPMIAGTIAVTLGAVALAAPLALASAVFCRYYAPGAIAAGYRRLVHLLAGVPSVVFGFWGLVVLIPILARLKPPGPSLLAGILIVGLMILPTIMLLAESALAAVPESYVLGGVALGMGRWAVIRHIAIPTARRGIVTGVILGGARAIGETMAVVMVCGNIIRTPHGLFDPVRTLTANIALEMGYALGMHRSALFVSGLVLLVIAVVMVAATTAISRYPSACCDAVV